MVTSLPKSSSDGDTWEITSSPRRRRDVTVWRESLHLVTGLLATKPVLQSAVETFAAFVTFETETE
ncbi:hypothetical protein YC2023_027302 [Brassica napus]